MRMNTILSGIAICLLLLALPAAASDYTLGIFGNANEDETINMQDVTYTELIILEYRDKTELADGKYDGKINMQDVTQIELVILGREKELTIVDALGDAITVNKPVTRIVTLPPSSLDTIRTIGAEDKVVGISTYLDEVYFPELSKLPSVGSSWLNPDLEKIIELKPDAVFTLTNWNPGIEDKLVPVGIPVVRLEFNKPTGIPESITKLGYILDKKNKAKEFLDWYNGYIDEIEARTERLSDDEKPRVYEGFLDEVLAKGDIWYPACEIAGGINIATAAGIEGRKSVDPEWVVVQNPDIMVFGMHPTEGEEGYSVDDPADMKRVRDEIMNRPEFANVNAVKTGRVHLFAWQIGLGMHSVISTAYRAKWFHPDLFEDLDPQEIHQEYLTEFQGLDYDLNEQGVFVYTPLEES